MTIDRHAPFPVDYMDGEFRRQTTEWYRELKDQHPVRPHSRSFPPPNIMADEILTVFDLGDRTVELSQVTMPAFGERPRRDLRFIGVTYYDHGDQERKTAGPFSTFAELEDWLGVSTSKEDA